MKIKVCDAPIEVLNYLVAKIECLPKDRLYLFHGKPFIDRECLGHIDTLRCEFSTNWTQGGPIIERELIDTKTKFKCANMTSPRGQWYWQASTVNEEDVAYWFDGPTPLVAAMRCFVASKLGEEIEVPDELMR